MALKTNFTDSNVISSPFVDEIANPAHAPGMARAQQGLQDVNTEIEIQRRANELENPTPNPKPTKPPAKAKGFAEGLGKHKRDVQNILDDIQGK